MSDDNVFHQVKRDAVQEARVGNTSPAAASSSQASAAGQGTPSTFRLGNASLHPFRLDDDELPSEGDEESATAYLW